MNFSTKIYVRIVFIIGMYMYIFNNRQAQQLTHKWPFPFNGYTGTVRVRYSMGMGMERVRNGYTGTGICFTSVECLVLYD